MKMRTLILVMCMALLLLAGVAGAAEKSKAQNWIDAAKGAIEAFSIKAGDNKLAADEISQARTLLKKAEDLYSGGRQMFGLGDVKPEAEQDIRRYTGMVDQTLMLAQSKMEKARAGEEFETLSKQLAKVKAKVKVFEDRKAEIEKLRADAVKCETAAKDLATAKTEKAALASQVELLMAERGKAEKAVADAAEMTRKLEVLKSENAKLSDQLEKMSAERKSLSAQLEEAKKGNTMRYPVGVSSPVAPPATSGESSATPVKEKPADPVKDKP